MKKYTEKKVWTIHTKSGGELITVILSEENVKCWFNDPRSHEIYAAKRSVLRIPKDEEKGGGDEIQAVAR